MSRKRKRKPRTQRKPVTPVVSGPTPGDWSIGRHGPAWSVTTNATPLRLPTDPVRPRQIARIRDRADGHAPYDAAAIAALPRLLSVLDECEQAARHLRDLMPALIAASPDLSLTVVGLEVVASAARWKLTKGGVA